MTINTGSIAKALVPGVHKWYGLSYNELPEQYKEIFDIERSDRNAEEDVNIHGLGLLTVKPQGGNISYGTMAQGPTQRYIHVTYAHGFIITREAVEDNLYMDLAKKQTQALARSARQTKEIVCANVLNRAFNSSYTLADGLELCSTAHIKTAGGTYSNELAVAADLSEASLEQVLIDIAGFTDDVGNRISAMGDKLIIPKELMFEAERLMRSSHQSDSANNAINAIRSKGLLPQGYCVNRYLTDSDAWFVKTNVQDGLKLFQRRNAELSNDTDFDSENMRFKITERYSVGATNARGIFGSPGA